MDKEEINDGADESSVDEPVGKEDNSLVAAILTSSFSATVARLPSLLLVSLTAAFGSPLLPSSSSSSSSLCLFLPVTPAEVDKTVCDDEEGVVNSTPIGVASRGIAVCCASWVEIAEGSDGILDNNEVLSAIPAVAAVVVVVAATAPCFLSSVPSEDDEAGASVPPGEATVVVVVVSAAAAVVAVVVVVVAAAVVVASAGLVSTV